MVLSEPSEADLSLFGQIPNLEKLVATIRSREISACLVLQGTASEEPKLTRNSKEVEAESVAYTVCQHYGIETSDYSFAYIAGWSKGKETPELKASLNRIRIAANEMITEIDGHMAELEKAMEQTEERSSVLADLHAKAEDHSLPHIPHRSKAKEETR